MTLPVTCARYNSSERLFTSSADQRSSSRQANAGVPLYSLRVDLVASFHAFDNYIVQHVNKHTSISCAFGVILRGPAL